MYSGPFEVLWQRSMSFQFTEKKTEGSLNEHEMLPWKSSLSGAVDGDKDVSTQQLGDLLSDLKASISFHFGALLACSGLDLQVA